MKKLLSTLGLVLAVATAQAQAKHDKIIKLSGDELAVDVTAVGEKDITFVYPGEKATNTVSQAQVKEIAFASGRVQRFTAAAAAPAPAPAATASAERVIIRGEADWAKVQLTTNAADVAGLVSRGPVKVKAAGATMASDLENVDKRATEKFKKAAAKIGAHIILVQNETKKDVSFGGPATSSKEGTAYGY